MYNYSLSTTSSNNNMKLIKITKLLLFYIICCLSNAIIWYYETIDMTLEDGKPFSVLYYYYIILVYAPVNTFVVFILEYENINKTILNNVFAGLMYSILPIMVAYIYEWICRQNNIEIYRSVFYVYVVSFIFMNLVIILHELHNKEKI